MAVEDADEYCDQRIAFTVPAAFIERVAELAAELVMSHGSQTSSSPYLTVAEAADRLRANAQRIYDLCSSGRLTRLRDGSRVLLSRDEIDAYLTEGRRSPVAPPLPPTPRNRSGRGVAV
jgi:excisionase family DNA binding protein